MNEAHQQLKFIADIIKRITTSEYPQAIEGIMEYAIQLIGAERATVFLLSKKKRLLVAYLHVKSGSLQELSLPSNCGVVGKTIRTGKVQICNDAYSDPDFYPDVDQATGYETKNLLCAPLINDRGEIMGAIELINSLKGGFTEEDATLLNDIAQIASVLIQQILELRKYKEVEQKLREDKNRLKVILKDLEDTFLLFDSYKGIVGKSSKIKQLLELCAKIAKTDIPVYIYGESGSGKELLAREIHNNSLRRMKRFVSINCAAFPETLLESEFFGYKKGAFTGAYADKIGVFEEANESTLFLDEIAEMSPALQGKLLRVLETGEFRMLGDNKTRKVDVRLISSSNKDLYKLICEGKFREDLFYRICGLRLDIPPLRERKEDIPILVNYFNQEFCKQLNKKLLKINPNVMHIFYEYNWQGNVRELKNEIYKLVILSDNEITIEHISSHIKSNASTEELNLLEGNKIMPLSKIEKTAIEHALILANRKKSLAAKALGISRKTLYNKLKEYNLE